MVNYVCFYNYIHFDGSEINSLVLESKKEKVLDKGQITKL